MTHPPIPSSTEWFFQHHTIDGKESIYQRKIISAVARCAWLDEAERLRHDKVWLSDPWDMRTGRARENAEAWREWGETK